MSFQCCGQYDDDGVGDQQQTAGGVSLDREQDSVYWKIMIHTRWCVEALQQRDAAWQAHLREEAWPGDWKNVLGTDHAFALHGPAGSGKSTVVEQPLGLPTMVMTKLHLRQRFRTNLCQ